VFTATGSATYWTAIAMFVLLGMGFLVVRLPSVVREVQAESNVGDVPLRRRERLNLELVALISESLQVAFVSGAIWLFYVLLGGLLVSAEVRGAWLLQPTTVIWDVAWFGERVQVTAQLRDTFERRSEYLDLLRRRGVAAPGTRPSRGRRGANR
jgi:hypothetical protein